MKKRIYPTVFFIAMFSTLAIFVNNSHALGIGMTRTWVQEFEKGEDGLWYRTGVWSGFSRMTIPVDYGSNHLYTFYQQDIAKGAVFIRREILPQTYNSQVFPDESLFLTGWLQSNTVDRLLSPIPQSWILLKLRFPNGYGTTFYSFPEELRSFDILTISGSAIGGYIVRPEDGHVYTEDFQVRWRNSAHADISGGIGGVPALTNTITFDVSDMPPPDDDNDGVPNDQDICPGGDDSLDSDQDDVPDFCDQCPNDPENDSDGDGICESDDNCPTTYNPDQFNFDDDNFGNACDADDDNDGVDDETDNCPFDENPDQSDYDNDKVGDVCDKDDDSDGITDAEDECVYTKLGESVNTEGCSIADLCPCENQWKNHGAYMRCVAHTSEDFVYEGIITEEAEDIIVSNSAGSECGHKK